MHLLLERGVDKNKLTELPGLVDLFILNIFAGIFRFIFFLLSRDLLLYTYALYNLLPLSGIFQSTNYIKLVFFVSAPKKSAPPDTSPQVLRRVRSTLRCLPGSLGSRPPAAGVPRAHRGGSCGASHRGALCHGARTGRDVLFSPGKVMGIYFLSLGIQLPSEKSDGDLHGFTLFFYKVILNFLLRR